MQDSSAWTAKVNAKSSISGANSLSCNFTGSLAFTVFLAQTQPQAADAPVVPQYSVAGRMVGTFDMELSTATRRYSGEGTAGWNIGGTYDPAKQSVSVMIRSTGVDAKGLETVLSEGGESSPPKARPFTTTYQWGWPTPKASDPSSILNALRPPMLPVIPSEREADLNTVLCLPQTGLTEFQDITLDLKDSDLQTVVQTFEDETHFGVRTTTWEIMLVPHFEIEREDRGADGKHSLISTDSPSFRMEIPGVTVAESGWANLASWEVKGLGPFSGSGEPNRVVSSTTFGFQPNPPARPVEGSMVRNRPLQYDVSSVFEGIEQHFLLTQDEIDLLRQEYVDHHERKVPSRAECVPHSMDGSFNIGNYGVIVDGGMEAALERVRQEFAKLSQGTVRVVSGFRSPQRNKASGDAHPGNPHVYGRALDLAPDPLKAQSISALYRACMTLGYHTVCEAGPGKVVSPESAGATQVHIDW